MPWVKFILLEQVALSLLLLSVEHLQGKKNAFSEYLFRYLIIFEMEEFFLNV